MSVRGSLLIALLVAGTSLSANNAWADVVTVINPSFEILPDGGLPTTCGTGCSYNAGAIPGWILSDPGSTGEFQPGPPATTAYFDYVPDGITVAYSNHGTISQTVGATVQVGTLYTLTVDLGNRNEVGYDDVGSADLLVNGVQHAATGVEAAPGMWTTWTATYVGQVADAGKAITIELNASGVQGDYDNVSLTAPEPGSLLLLGVIIVTLLGLGMLKRTRSIH